MLALVVVLTLQADVPADYAVIRDSGNHASLFAYTGWSMLTLGVGIGGIVSPSHPFWQGVHLGHLVWGGVNTVIAGISLGTTFLSSRDPEADPLQEGRGSQLAYAINAIFDVATLFVSAGIFLATPDARWQGFASASLVQSAFLLLYDVTMSLYHQLNNDRATL
jgi:hypothetical protein